MCEIYCTSKMQVFFLPTWPHHNKGRKQEFDSDRNFLLKIHCVNKNYKHIFMKAHNKQYKVQK